VSHEVSQAITRKSASNLALAFVLLPPPKRRGMAALYAFCREVDDVADDETQPAEERRKQLTVWRNEVRQACAGGEVSLPVIRELAPVIKEYHLPFKHFDELLRGVEMDLEVSRYATFQALQQYCYRVASVVGVLSIEIFGYRNPKRGEYAVQLGYALQLTNILRDVRNDAERGRIYLPNEDLQAYGVTPDEILQSRYSDRFQQVARCMAKRAHGFYRRASQALPAEDRRSMIAAELMGAVYYRLLVKLERRRFNVFGSRPVRVSKATKLFLILRTWLQLSVGIRTANYGKA